MTPVTHLAEHLFNICVRRGLERVEASVLRARIDVEDAIHPQRVKVRRELKRRAEALNNGHSAPTRVTDASPLGAPTVPL